MSAIREPACPKSTDLVEQIERPSRLHLGLVLFQSLCLGLRYAIQLLSKGHDDVDDPNSMR